jgi:sigma-E factor negative regulatory protein RseC
MEQITHKGRIVAIDPDFTTIEIIAESACASCHAKGLCSLGEAKVKEVQVRTSAWTPRQVGDEVEVALRKAMGYKAVFIAYGLPLVVLFAALLILNAIGVGELYAGLGAIGSSSFGASSRTSSLLFYNQVAHQVRARCAAGLDGSFLYISAHRLFRAGNSGQGAECFKCFQHFSTSAFFA